MNIENKLKEIADTLLKIVPDNYIVCHFDAICISFRHLFLVSLLE